jgi:hypothetical protein
VLNQIPSSKGTHIFSSTHPKSQHSAVNSMAGISESKASRGPPDPNVTPRPQALVQDYLLEHLPIYRELRELQKQASIKRLGSHPPLT